MHDEVIKHRTAEALDKMQGLEAQVAHRRFLGNHSLEQISHELGLDETETIRIAAAGLKHIKQQVFDK